MKCLDWSISWYAPTYVRGLHSNFLRIEPPYASLHLLVGSYFPSLIFPNKRDQNFLFPVKDLFKRLLKEAGYYHIQATKPDTAGYGLTDSPVGLAAYILEKFSGWTNPSFIESPDGQLTKKFELDDLLNNVMIYWISGSITSSMRLYKELYRNHSHSLHSAPVSVPTGYAAFPHEVIVTPEPWLPYVFKNIVSYTANFPDGGHFAAFEEPKLLAEDIRQFSKLAEEFLKKAPEK